MNDNMSLVLYDDNNDYILPDDIRIVDSNSKKSEIILFKWTWYRCNRQTIKYK